MRRCKGLKRGREEHRLIIGVSYEEDDALVAEESGRWWRGKGRGEVPQREEENGRSEKGDDDG